MKVSKDIISSIRKLFQSPCCLPSVLLCGPPLTLHLPKTLFCYISPRIRKQSNDCSPPSSEAKVIIGLEFWFLFFFFLCFLFSLNLVCSRVKWTTVLISSMHTQVILKATDRDWSQRLAANPLVILNSGGKNFLVSPW